MNTAPQELMKEYVQSQHFTSTAEIMTAMKEMFRDVLQTVMEVEMPTDVSGGGSDLMDDTALETTVRIHGLDGLHHAARQKILCKRRQVVVKETGANQRISRVGHNPA